MDFVDIHVFRAVQWRGLLCFGKTKTIRAGRDGFTDVLSVRLPQPAGSIAAFDIERERAVTAYAHFDFDGPAAHLENLYLPRRAGRRVHAGFKGFAAARTGDFHEFQHGCILLHVLATHWYDDPSRQRMAFRMG
jgi:hypothetical protein